MAFERNDFQRVGAGLAGIAPSVFTYSSVADTIAAQRCANYYNDAAAELSKGDIILHGQQPAGNATGTVSVVQAISAAGVVAIAAIS